jgi:hypothetical protein
MRNFRRASKVAPAEIRSCRNRTPSLRARIATFLVIFLSVFLLRSCQPCSHGGSCFVGQAHQSVYRRAWRVALLTRRLGRAPLSRRTNHRRRLPALYLSTGTATARAEAAGRVISGRGTRDPDIGMGLPSMLATRLVTLSKTLKDSMSDGLKVCNRKPLLRLGSWVI